MHVRDQETNSTDVDIHIYWPACIYNVYTNLNEKNHLSLKSTPSVAKCRTYFDWLRQGFD